MAAIAAALAGMGQPVFHILMQQLNIAMIYFIAKLDCQICSVQSI